MINLDASHLRAYDASHELYWHLKKYPVEMIPIMDHVFSEYVVNHFDTEIQSIKVRPFNIDNSINMRELDPHGILLI